MAEVRVSVSIDWPNWASAYIRTLRRRLADGERVDVAAAAKLIQAFANYRINRHG